MRNDSKLDLIPAGRGLIFVSRVRAKAVVNGAVGATLVVAAFGATVAVAAGNHHICYQERYWNNDVYQPTIVAQCRSDIPGVYCSAIRPGAGLSSLPLSSVPPAVGNGFARKFLGVNAARHSVTIAFSDGTERVCTTSLSNAVPPLGNPQRSASDATLPELVGYTTDSSGLVTTGIWSSRSTAPSTFKANTITVPGDFVAVGGGATGTEAPNGALISKTFPGFDSEKRKWTIQTRHAVVTEAHTNTVYAIGMKIEGINKSNLRSLVSLTSATSAPSQAHPRQDVYAPSTSRVLGGGVDASGSYSPQGFGQYLTVSIPVNSMACLLIGPSCPPAQPVGWFGAAKDHGVSSPGSVDTWVIHMPSIITVDTANGATNFNVENIAAMAKSPFAGHPSIVTPGFPGAYALTSVGAQVYWEDSGYYGNLLWNLVPRGDIAGVEAASKDHAYASPASIHGYAIGIRLMP